MFLVGHQEWGWVLKRRQKTRFTCKKYFFGCSVHANLKAEAQAGSTEGLEVCYHQAYARDAGSNCEDRSKGMTDLRDD